jgi:hypothetical protein
VENNKSFFWTQGIIVILLCLTGTVSIGFMMLVRPKISEAQSYQNININDVAANTGTQERIEQFKTTMLTTWQKEAQAKGIITDVPSRFQGATIKSYCPDF